MNWDNPFFIPNRGAKLADAEPTYQGCFSWVMREKRWGPAHIKALDNVSLPSRFCILGHRYGIGWWRLKEIITIDGPP